MDISTGKLQQLLTVARCGSFSKAAMELNISQPALSRSVATLEDRYGFQIFSRMGHGVQLTAAGAQVIAQAEPLLQSMRVFDNNLRLLGSGKAGSLSLGFAPLLASQQLPQLAGDFFSTATRAELRILIRSGAALLESLKTDAIELMFFPEGYIESLAELDVQAVGSLTPILVVRRGHPLAKRASASLSIQDLADFPWASSVEPPMFDKLLGPARLICDNYHILRESLLQTDLICICSSAFVAQQLADGSLRELRIKGLNLPTTAVHAAKLKGRISSPLAQEAVARVRRALAKPRAAKSVQKTTAKS